METLTTEFWTYHLSAKDVHLRTADGIVWIDKSKPELIALAKALARHQSIRVQGERVMSKTLSSHVLHAESLEILD